MTGTTLDDYTDRYSQRMRGMTQSEIRALFSLASRPEVVSLAGGNPYTTALPLEAVGELMREVMTQQGATALLYCPGQGDATLRERICDVMTRSGIDAAVGASPDDVVVTVGGQQGIDLISRVFLDPGDVVLAEGPTYVGALGVFQSAQARVVHVPMDQDGMLPEALEEAIAAIGRAGRRAKFLYTVPTFQNPAGVTLSEQRRERVLEICQRAGLLVVEDDPYGMLSYDGAPPAPLRSRVRDGICYVGTFSKTFAAGLRVGWVLAPHAVREKLVLASEAQILCPSMLAQATVSRYLTTMPWQEQIKAFQELYRERRDTLLASLGDFMPAGTGWTVPGGGLFVWVTLPEDLDSKAMLPRAINARVAYVPGTGFYADGSGHQYLRLNFSFPPSERIREGVRRLAGVIDEELELRATFGAPARGRGARPAAGASGRSPRAVDTPGPDIA